MDIKNFFGWLLITIGGLLAVLTGGCGCFWLVATLIHAGGDIGGLISMLMILLILSAVPCVIGIAIALSGRQLLSATNEPDSSRPNK